MNTGGFNLLDKWIAKLRLGQVMPFVREGEVVLDFGCGVQAYLLRQTQEKLKEGYGLDYDIATRREEKLSFVRFRYETQLPFPDRFFDKIFMLAVLEHLEESQAQLLFSEFHRILKPSGEIVLTTPTPRGQVILEFLAFRLKIISQEEIRDHKKYYTPQDLQKLAQHHHLCLSQTRFFQCGLNSLYVLKKG